MRAPARALGTARSLVVAGVGLLATSGCALVSGLVDLGVDDGGDASLADATADVPSDGASRDRSSDAPPIDAFPPPADVAVDAPPLDAGSDVVTIQCGTGTCPITEVCCNHVANGKSTFTCGDAGTCKGNGDFVLSCDALSCGAGKRCCMTLTFNGGITATAGSCAATCPTGMTLCRADAGDASPACGFGQTCQPSVQMAGYEGCQL